MDKQSFQNELKTLYFKNQSKVECKTKLPYHCKTTNDILKNISKQKNFSRIKERLYIAKVLEKILLKPQLDWISYSYINSKNTLVIYVKNHVFQEELNYHKEHILKSFQTVEKYKQLLKVSIMRDDNNKKTPIEFYKPLSNEKSFGIFENNLTDVKLRKYMENIREYIRSVKKK